MAKVDTQKNNIQLTKEEPGNKILLDKKKLRKEILNRLRSQDKEDLLKRSLKIKNKLFELEEFKKARCVIFYVSMEDEVDTRQMIDESIRMGKTVGVPVIISTSGGEGKRELAISQITDRIKQLEVGPYRIIQPKQIEVRPISCKNMDLILVPAVAYDESGNRLGRGKGYYDRFLEKLPDNALTIGLCFDFQLIKSVPMLSHDISVRKVLTDA